MEEGGGAVVGLDGRGMKDEKGNVG
jgi:hypothetical protein